MGGGGGEDGWKYLCKKGEGFLISMHICIHEGRGPDFYQFGLYIFE